MPRYIAFNKPYGVLSQFTPEAGHPALDGFGLPPDLYPAGRLDRDSEGLLLLTDDGPLIARLLDPKRGHPRTYFVEVEGEPSDDALDRLRSGIALKDGPTRGADVRQVSEPDWIWPRNPPVRFRKSIPTAWIELTLTEGRNRQVRRMTAAVGLPTLRLIRVRIGRLELGALAPGCWREVVREDLVPG